MTRLTASVLVLAALVAAGAGAYWFAHRDASMAGSMPAISATNSPVIYYRDPDGKPFYAAEPKQTADGRAYLPVKADDEVSFEPATQAAASGTKRVLYYRNPMGLPDVSNTPKKDSMGMDYIAVYEGETDDSAVTLTPGKLQRIGVTTDPVLPRILSEPVRAPGTIQLDERRISVITLRTEAFVESVSNVTTGSEVTKGQPLLHLYSPAIASAAAEYVALLRASRTSEVPSGTRQRLLNFGVSEDFIAGLERDKTVPLTFTWTAPRSGIVLERNVTEGQRVAPGEVLFRIADHSVVWALVDVAERDLASVAAGQPVQLRVRSFPDKSFGGKVALVYPHLNPATRTVRVRVELPNSDYVLRPDMYAESVIDTNDGEPVLAVPESAVIDSGDRQVVLVDKGGGRFEPRHVRLGKHGQGYVEVKEGVVEGDTVVTSANFLIDAESNLKGALKALTAGQTP
jgi:Cu(I)/Ag(I) efflux system membrane fusion protein